MIPYSELIIFIVVTFFSSIYINIKKMDELRGEITFQTCLYNYNKGKNILFWFLFCIIIVATNNNIIAKTYYFIFLYNYTSYKFFNCYMILWLLSIIFNTKLLHLIAPYSLILLG